MSNLAKFVMALVGLVAMLLVASRQLFLFVVMRDPLGLSIAGGRSHVWLAVIAGVIACVAGGLMFYFFSRHENNKWSKVEMTPTGPLLSSVTINRATSPAPAPFDARRWALANSWLVKQPDDRTPMDGSVRDIGGTPSEQRSFARRTHQLMFKKWSQDRHD
jgi:membrane protein YqaA with SNARE-associated domain